MTTIQDVLYKADGSRFNGTAFIEWRSFEAVDSSAIMTQSLTVQIIGGNLRVQLVPTTNAAGSAYYSVRYNSDGRVQFSEIWHVPPSTIALRLRDVRVAESSGEETLPGAVGTEVQMSDVVGLMAELASRPIKAPLFTNSRAARINSLGELESVAGNTGDCVRVDGTSAACSTSPAFVDAETPAGSVNGSNTAFALLNAPNPASSLALYRNGVMQKLALDYTISGTAITFTSAATPQTGDTLLASYRLGGASSLAYLSSLAQPPEVLCGGTGAMTSGAVATALGSCTIPAGTLQAGDRIEIRADYAHSGTSVGFSFEVKWGSTTLVSRAAAATERATTAKGESAVNNGGALWSAQSWGSTLGLLAGAGSATDAIDVDLTVSFLGRMASQSTESVALQGYTVTRYPSRVVLVE